ncbi:MAG TPA: GNAT family N-acetyltransferase [Candidatus Polarisedimenticolaceae bacterium]
MPTLNVARSDQIEAVYEESHALWGAGLDFTGYHGLWEDLRRTAWGRDHLRFLVWTEGDGPILSSMKLYRPRVRLRGRTRRACAIGAVFTPRARRRRGHAAAMLMRVLEEAAAAGDGPAMLFSDIGTGYYASLGFRELPAEEAHGTLARAPRGLVGWSLRPMLPEDLPAVAEAHDAWCATRPIAVLRDLAHWRFLLERARSYFARFDGSDLSRRYRVATRDGRFAGYVVAVEGEGEWELREAGAVDADPDTLAQLLRVAAAEARARGLRRVFGWIPRSQAALVPEWGLRQVARMRAVPMLRALDATSPTADLLDAEAAFLPYLDQF